MKIGIDISQIQYEGTGVARYTLELVAELLQQDKRNTYTLFYNSFHTRLKNIQSAQTILSSSARICEFSLPEKVLHVIWNTFSILSIEHFIGRQDIYFYSDWFTPPVNARTFTTVHDLAFRLYPKTIHPYVRSSQEKRLNRISKSKGNLIFTDSFSTRNDLQKYYSIPPNRIKVIYPGVTSKKQNTEKVKKTLQRFELREREFILVVGTLEPRKNLSRLFEAYTNIKGDFPLIVVGKGGWGSLSVKDSRVQMIGFVDDEELFALYQSAIFFVMPSLYEGFGFPVVEAMSLGCPVCLSKTSSLIEVGSDAAVYFNPLSVSDMVRVLQIMLTDSALRKKNIQKGIVQARKFNWTVTAKQVIREFNRVESI
ncbi:hypothetical protein COU88_04400 [Candidatus Roizmanbacteria bacterium CG10_big_fil_rev_8_21_14_0_10_39_6]|uniref:Glycosyltransferase family 1 protein n=1 Tax=Candidatus Roizmanbacteria bacterium CG10_big_fil_rev_8_21_14_0_10_39_6 TaxID=1974853 RepID=A0A2M8KRJ3_9BACT|nr:MAG: hypothetical protein COU88_04400 [Candidatus Roizmanbacteria bacterium CG10_big_fil_rev_8_21_14_0_10_39_6]